MIAGSWLAGAETAAWRFQTQLEDLNVVFDKLQFLLDHYETFVQSQAA